MMFSAGWLAASAYLLIVAIGNIFWKLSAYLDFHAAVYVSQSMMIGAFVLLFLSKPGPLSLETFRHASTWLYGVFFFIGGMISVIALGQLDASPILLLNNSSVIFTFIISWLILGKETLIFKRLPFQCALIAAIVLVFAITPLEALGVAMLACFAGGLTSTMRMLSVETHKPNNDARNLEQEVRVTGIVMATTGLSSYLILIILTTCASLAGVEQMPSFIPEWADYFNAKSVLVAALYGVFCFSTMRYLEFYSVKRIGGMNFLALLSLLPLAVLIVEYGISLVGLVPMHMVGFPIEYIVSLSLAVTASLGIIFTSKKKVRSASGKGPHQMERDQQLAAYTMQYCNGDEAQAAKLLGVSKNILNIALHEKDPAKALPPKMSDKIQAQFTKNVSFMDALTGLMNKTHFMSLFKAILERGDKGTVLFLDLNKFKPVNDTHGHEAGDEVLKIVARRLENAARRNSVIARLGGDEFAVLLTNIAPAKALEVKARIEQQISEPMRIDGLKESVNIGTSVGVANYPAEGTTAEGLLDMADKAMYVEKKGNG